MNIVCAGMKRSGSTWLYNVVRLACANEGVTWAGFEDTFNPTRCEHRVVKTHKFAIEWVFGADKVFGSIRDLRDVAASAVRRGLVGPTPESVIRWLLKTAVDEHEAWEGYCDLIVRYEDMVADKAKAAAGVLDALGIKADVELLVKNVASLPKPGTKAANPITLLHHNHFTDGGTGTWDKTLSAEIVHAIEAVFGEWMEKRGYPLCEGDRE